MTTDARALIAEGQRHEATFSAACDSGSIEVVGETKDEHARIRASVEWVYDNLATLLDGYTAALDEVERVTRERDEALDDGVLSQRVCDIENNRAQLRQDLAALRTCYGEQHLVIEQQDRDLARLKQYLDVANGIADRERDTAVSWETKCDDARARVATLERDLAASRDTIRHFEQERDSWPLAYRQRAAQTDKRIAELEGALRDLRADLNGTGWETEVDRILEGDPCTTTK